MQEAAGKDANSKSTLKNQVGGYAGSLKNFYFFVVVHVRPTMVLLLQHYQFFGNDGGLLWRYQNSYVCRPTTNQLFFPASFSNGVVKVIWRPRRRIIASTKVICSVSCQKYWCESEYELELNAEGWKSAQTTTSKQVRFKQYDGSYLPTESGASYS